MRCLIEGGIQARALDRARLATVAFMLAVAVCATDPFTTRCAALTNRDDGSGITMGRPIIGYVAHSSPLELRAILGIPGAAVFSDPLLLPRHVTRIRLAPSQQYALIERERQEPVVLLLTAANAGRAVSLAGAFPVADLAAFSPFGRSAVLFSVSAKRLQVIAGLPDAPQIVRDLDVGVLPEPPEAMAISDDAGSVLLSSAGAVYWLLPGGSTRMVVNVADVPALVFFPNSANAAIGDRTAGSVYLFRNLAGGITTSLLATGLDGLEEITSSGSYETLYITKPRGQCIWSIRVATGEVRAFKLGVNPVRMQQFRPLCLLVLERTKAGCRLAPPVAVDRSQ